MFTFTYFGVLIRNCCILLVEIASDTWELEGNGFAVRMHLKHVTLGILLTQSLDMFVCLYPSL